MSKRPPTIGEFFAHEARSGIQDIRQKLFEEAWFGRVVSAEPVMEVSREREPDRTRQSTFDEIWGRATKGPDQPDHLKDRESPTIDR